MPRRSSNTDPRTVYRCVEPFAIWEGRTAKVYGQADEVLGDDPVLSTHRAHFREAADLIERATAAPGEKRNVTLPHPTQFEESPDE